MTIETTQTGIVLIIALMFVVSLITRFGGSFLMERVPLNRRVESFINTMASSVLIAIVVPMAFAGDIGARAALVTTTIVMLASGRALPSIAAGVAAAGVTRYLIA